MEVKSIISQVGEPTRNFPIWYSTPYYLKISGGTGHGDTGVGGTYHFTGTYLNPEQSKHMINGIGGISCLSSFCKSAGINFWHGNTFEELVDQMKGLTINDITTVHDPAWKEYVADRKKSNAWSLENTIKIWENRADEAKSYKNAVRKDGNYRKDIQKTLDRCRFEIEKAKRELKTYEPELV